MRRSRSLALAVAGLLVVSACRASGGAPTTTTPVVPVTTTSAVATAPTATSAPAPGGSEPAAELEVVGQSVLGRPLLAATIGSGAQRVYVVGSIHGDERTAAETSEALLNHLGSSPPGVTVRWLLDANPDGTAARTRDNAAGVDLNRNWPTGHEPSVFHGDEPLSEPETQAVAADIAAFSPTLIVAMHSAREGPFVDHDGPGADQAHAFATGASVIRPWEVVPEVAWATPGSLGTHYGVGLGIPVITVEGSRWDTPEAVVPEIVGGLDAMFAAISGGGEAPVAPECTDHAIGDACTPLTRTAMRVLAETTGSTGATFLVKEAGGVVLAARRADWSLYPASSIKALHLVHLLTEAGDDVDSAFASNVPLPADGCTGEGGVVGSETLGRLVEQMMIDSDNEAANAIQALVGLDGLAATAAAADMEDTAVYHGFGCGGPANEPANVSSTADLVRLYDAALAGDLLTEEARSRLLDELRDVTGDVVDGAGDPLAGARVLVKGGWFGERRTIAGVALFDERAVLFAVHAHSSQLPGPGSGLIGVVGRILRAAIGPEGR